MTDWIYCGSASQVTASGTQTLLRTHQAIWCSPPRLRPWPGTPLPGERLWLLWQESSSSPAVSLLGGGRVAKAPSSLRHKPVVDQRRHSGFGCFCAEIGLRGTYKYVVPSVGWECFPLGGSSDGSRGLARRDRAQHSNAGSSQSAVPCFVDNLAHKR